MSAAGESVTAVSGPIYFGPTDRPRFGWLHRPPPGVATRAEGMVVCNPFGGEVLSAHRSLRHMAEASAAQGLPTLRFDYDGTGDSAGSDRDPGRLAAWLRSVHDAVDELRRRTGVVRVHLLGLRLGATLAAMAAVEREDVAGLVAIVPVVSGRQWQRELTALQQGTRVGGPPAGAATDPGFHESGGFVMTPETWESLAGIDLLSLDRRPAPEALVIDRSDLKPNQRFPDRLVALGSLVDHRQLPGYAEMMLDAHDAVVPEGMIRVLCAWVAERSSTAGRAAAIAGSTLQAPKRVPVTEDVVETAVFLDDDRGRFGVVSEPATGAAPTQAIILLNSGANHRTGPGRLYVNLARHWASHGYTVLRVDLRGLGDSPAPPGESENEVYPPWAVDDVRHAEAYLRRTRKVTACTGMGICSGGYHALKAAVGGVPLTGVVLINPLVFFWKPGMSLSYPPYLVLQSAAQYRKSLFQLSKWRKVLGGRVEFQEVGGVVLRRAAGVAEAWTREAARRVGRPLVDDVGAELAGLARRGVSISFVFAAGNPGEGLLREQAGSTIRRLVRDGRVSIHRLEGPDHTFSPVWSHVLLRASIDRELGIG